MNMNFQQILQFIKAGNNPEQLLMAMLSMKAKNNPVMQNILQLVQMKDYQGIETVARNLSEQRGVDFDKAFNDFRNNLGL